MAESTGVVVRRFAQVTDASLQIQDLVKVDDCDNCLIATAISKSTIANVNVIVVLNANVLRLDEDRRQRRSETSIWT